MADEATFDGEELVSELKVRVARERAEGAYADADELAGIELEPPPSMLTQGFDLDGTAGRITFRPELGFSSKPVVGHLITGVKKLNLRLLFFVLDDLARQADAAVVRLEAALAAEAAAREVLSESLEDEIAARRSAEEELKALSARTAALEERAKL